MLRLLCVFVTLAQVVRKWHNPHADHPQSSTYHGYHPYLVFAIGKYFEDAG